MVVWMLAWGGVAGVTGAEVKEDEDQVLVLDGRGSYVALPESLGSEAEVFTVAMWVRWDDWSYYGTAFHVGDKASSMGLNLDAGGPLMKWYWQYQEGQPRKVLWEGEVPLGRWFHVAGTGGADGLRLWVNGRCVGTQYLEHGGLKRLGAAARWLGRSSWPNNGYFRGRMDEVQVWDRALDAEELRRLTEGGEPASTAGRLAWWRMNRWEDTVGGRVTWSEGPNPLAATLHGGARLERADRGQEAGQPPWRIYGEVRNTSGEVVEAELRLRSPSGPVADWRTGVDGRFTRWGLNPVPGAWLEVRSGALGTRVDLDLRSGTEEVLDLQLRPAVAIEGRILLPDDRAHIGVRVEVRQFEVDGGLQAEGMAEETDRAGRFRFLNLMPGDYEVRCAGSPDPLSPGAWRPDEVFHVKVESGAEPVWIEARMPGGTGSMSWQRWEGRLEGFRGPAGVVVVNALGHVWIGSGTGLTRFDGTTTRTWTRHDGLPANEVTALAFDGEGKLWVGTTQGLAWLAGDRILVPSPGPWTSRHIHGITVSKEGAVWVAHIDGLWCWRDGEIRTWGVEDGLPASNVMEVWADPRGGIGASTEGAAYVRVTESGVEPASPMEVALQLPWAAEDSEKTRALFEARIAPAVEVAPGIRWKVSTGKVWRWDGRRIVTRNPVDPRVNPEVSSLAVVPGKEMWVVTQEGSLFRSEWRGPVNLGVEDGLPPGPVHATARSGDGALWVGTDDGLYRWQGGRMVSVAMGAGWEGVPVRQIMVGQGERLWLGTERGILLWDGRRTSMPPGAPLGEVRRLRRGPAGEPWAVVPGHGVWFWDGERWVGFEPNALHPVVWSMDVLHELGGWTWLANIYGLWRYRDGRLEPGGVVGRVPRRGSSTVVRSSDGALWVGMWGEGLYRGVGEEWRCFTQEDGLASMSITDLHEDRQGRLWVGTLGGLNLYRDGEWSRMDTSDGLSHNEIRQIRSEEDGSLWIATGGGITRYFPGEKAPPLEWRSVEADILHEDPSQEAVVQVGERLKFSVLTSGRNQIRWRREGPGESGGWTPMRSDREWDWRPTRPGQFRVEARAFDRDLNASMIRSWAVRVRQPWHLNPWVTGPLVVVVMGVMGTLASLAWKLRNQREEGKRLRAEARVLAAGETARTEFERRLIASQEQERSRMARELHDSLGQELLLIRQEALLARKHPDITLAGDSLDAIADRAARTIGEVRNIAYALRPQELDRYGWASAVGTLCEEMAERHGLELETRIDPGLPAMPSEVEIGLFRVVQEALTNVVRHAGARRICCEAKRGDGRLSVVVWDDGCGFDADRVTWPKDGTGCGLEGMRVRLRLLGGTLTVHTAPGQGTRVEASVPCPIVEGQPATLNPDGDEPPNPEETS